MSEFEVESEEPKRYKISPRATLNALSGLRLCRERVLIPETLDANLARGASASVPLAILVPPKVERPEHPSAQGHFVALKQFRLDDDKGDKAGLAPLAHELSLLSNLEHKNIVRVLGFVENVAQGIAWIVLPWAPNGNLRDFVRSKLAPPRSNITADTWSYEEYFSTWTGGRSRFALIKDVACGLDYLHRRSEPICHGDLKSLNVLVNEQHNAVITDFGSARIIGERLEVGGKTAGRSYSTRSQPSEGPRVEFSESTGTITMTGPSYTARWAAPEVLNGESPTLASDAWSLGWICWEVLTGEIPFSDILGDLHVVTRVLSGELPRLQGSLPNRRDMWVWTWSTISRLCTLVNACWAMDPHSRPKCCDFIECLADQGAWHSPDLHAKRGKVADSLFWLQAVIERHLSEERLGEALRYIEELRRVAWLTGRKPVAITFQEMLDRCRRSTSRLETVHEEEAAHSWNLALTVFTSQLYREAEGHVINASRLYKELGFEAQALDCDQFVDVIQDAMHRTLPRDSRGTASNNKDLPRLLLTRSEKVRDLLPTATDPIYEGKKKWAEMVWIVAGALQYASPNPLAVERVISLIEEYHPGRIRQSRESCRWSEKWTDTEFTIYILSSYDAFEADEKFGGSWRLGEVDLLPPFPRTKDFLGGYFTPLGSLG